MPVVDASVIAEYLAGGAHAEVARRALFDDERTRWVPHLVDAEVGQVLRRAVLADLLDADAGSAALADLIALPIVRAAHTSLLERAWELRENVSFSDAMYVALAERVRGSLITMDRRLARAVAPMVDVVVLGEA